MTTTSYPAVGVNGFDANQWAVQFRNQDGIVDDFTGNALNIDRIDATNTVRVYEGKVRVGGYVLEVTAPHDLVLAPVTAGAPVTYYVAASYDPLLNVADGSGNAATGGPCRLTVTAGPPSTAGGKAYVLLYTVVRAIGQALTVSTLADLRRWTGPLVEVATVPRAAPELNADANAKGQPLFLTGFGPFSRGTRVYETSTRRTFRMTWQGATPVLEPSVTDPVPLNMPSAFRAWDLAPAYFMAGSRVQLMGSIKRANDTPVMTATNDNDVLVGTLPASACPNRVKRFSVYAGGRHGPAFMKVEADGQVYVYGGGGVQIDWVDLSPISYEVGV